MLDDSTLAIELDDTNFKAYLRNGEALIELGKKKSFKNTELIEKGVKRLMKALSIAERLNKGDPDFE
jgi:hypothetical protein